MAAPTTLYKSKITFRGENVDVVGWIEAEDVYFNAAVTPLWKFTADLRV